MHPSLTLVIALTAGVVGQSVARHLRVPGIVILLAMGWGLGPDALGWVEPRSLGLGLLDIVELAVAVILFEGGLNLELSRLVRSQTAIRRLVTWGALITWGGATLAARLGLEWSWLQSTLFGSLVVVTGPTVIGPIVSELRLQPRLATVLEAEGVLIDPIGAILAVLVLEVALAPGAESIAAGSAAVVAQLGFGSAVGIAGGFALAALLRVRRIVPDGYENIFSLACVLLLFVGSNELVAHSGILAVPLAGVVVGNLRTRVDRDLKEFKDQLSVLLIGLLFVLLAADVRLADVQSLGWGALTVVAALVLIVRPIDVALCTAGSTLTLRERAFASWVAPRGIVAAAIASITATALESRGYPGGSELRALVFLTIAATVLLAGFTALPVASLLGVRLPGRERIGLLGVSSLGLILAEQLREAGRTVVFLDSNPQNCRIAEEAEFAVVFGNALQERTMQRARFESVGTAIGMTPNDALNIQFAEAAREFFKVPRTLVALRRRDVEIAHENERLFLSEHDLERWDVRARHGSALVQAWVFQGAPESAGEPEDGAARPWGERLVLLTVKRGKDLMLVTESYTPRAGDLASVVIHEPDLEEAEETLRKRGWEPAPPAEVAA